MAGSVETKRVVIENLVKITPAKSTSATPRAHGAVRFTVKTRENGTALKTLRQSGSFRALFPQAFGPDFQTVLINTAGGVTGGDTFNTKATAQSGSKLTITTQAAERAYRAIPGETGRICNHVVIEPGARVNWLPQETILFQGSAIQRSLKVEMTDDASLLMVEPLVFGRKMMGEVLTDASFTDRIEILRQDKIAYLDTIRLRGNIAEQMARPHVAAGASAMASLVYIAKDADARFAAVRSMVGDTGGASMIGDDILNLRLLASDSYLLRKTLIPILNLLTTTTLPRCWMI